MIHDADFKARHRQKATDFTRSRSLVFPLVMLFVLRKRVNSIQLMVNEWFDGLDQLCSARQKTPFFQR